MYIVSFRRDTTTFNLWKNKMTLLFSKNSTKCYVLGNISLLYYLQRQCMPYLKSKWLQTFPLMEKWRILTSLMTCNWHMVKTSNSGKFSNANENDFIWSRVFLNGHNCGLVVGNTHKNYFENILSFLVTNVFFGGDRTVLWYLNNIMTYIRLQFAIPIQFNFFINLVNYRLQVSGKALLLSLCSNSNIFKP